MAFQNMEVDKVSKIEELVKEMGDNSEIADRTQMMVLGSSDFEEFSKLTDEELHELQWSKGLYSDPSELPFKFQELCKMKKLDKILQMAKNEIDDKFKQIMEMDTMQELQIAKSSWQFGAAVGVLVAAALSCCKIEQILAVGVGLLVLFGFMSSKFFMQLELMASHMKIMKMQLLNLEKINKIMDLQLGWIFGSLRKIEFSTSSRSGNSIKVGMSCFDKISYLETRLMWLVSGAEDTARQIQQIMQGSDDFAKIHWEISSAFKLWAAARLRSFRIPSSIVGR